MLFRSGEDPNPTDSGYGFTRKARNLAGFDEDRIISHNYIFDGNCTPGSYVIFVDDFVGSGSQAYETMERKCDEGMMLIEHLQANNLKPIYCPLMCTEGGLHFLNQYSPDLMMVPTHMIDRRYSIFDKDSLCWSGETQKKGIDAVYKASMRAGIPDNPDSTKHWKGFQDQGLAISFSHGTPDATIPLLYWSENDWHPLIRK